MKKEMKVNVNIEKSPIPLVWIDTSIVIKMAKWKVGEKIDQLERQRVQYLYDIIRKVTKDKKLLCPEADQKEEYELGERLEEECGKIQTDLSWGVTMKHRQSVEELWTSRFMKGYINKDKRIELSYKDLFYNNPLVDLEEALVEKFIISVRFLPSKTNIDRNKAGKKRSLNELEAIRQHNLADGVTFEQQLEIEFKGTIDAHLEQLRRFIAKVKEQQVGFLDLLAAQSILNYERLWNNYQGQPAGLNGLVQFFASDYFKRIPKIEIVCHLYAKILTSIDPVKSGHMMDIEQVSSYLPFFGIIITDRYMKHIIKALKYHTKYRTKILTVRDFDEIKYFFENL